MSREVWKLLDAGRWLAEGADGQVLTACPPNAAQTMLVDLARRTPLRRGIFRATLSRLAFALGGGKPIDVGFRDAVFRLEGGRNLIEYGILLNEAYNQQDIDFLEEALSPGGVIVDIGCNIGLYSLPLAKTAGPQGHCISIDANPMMTGRLLRNAVLSGLDNITAFACAVSDRDGAGSLTVRKNDDAIVALVENDDGPIPVRTLMSVLSEASVDHIDVLKIDIEGHEDKALVPFLDSAPRALLPRRIVIEHPEQGRDYEGCSAAFDRHGYQLMGRSRNNSLYELRAV
ncbi:methyltransferase, FkbM family [Hoeflea sp. IMCC20628]|uniref:FkbM family methyltransferase n=1 Tax=Hoeflea sp. IMCC20628 TaxID=1620421 RepID=UPI00063BD4D9|nr:FkbM family methyltransferase [Hoeflea sp. IMCC20628]AKH99468.1 methyltransferase, FkbM family [Hoeflea sp. IMCC20628]